MLLPEKIQKWHIPFRLIVVFYFLPFCKTQAQTHVMQYTLLSTIKGVVIDSATKNILDQATVEVQEDGGEKTFKTTLTNEYGVFKITGLSQRTYQLILTYEGYKTTTIKIHLLTSSIDLGVIPLVSLYKELKELKVPVQKPIVEQDLDKLIYNVDADPDSKNATALEIFRKVPMITLDADDNLQLNGNNNYRILINGRPASLFSHNLSEVLKNLPASTMRAIEVITVPSAKYEAQGVGGIINIITYKKNISGYNGGVNTNIGSPKSYSANGSLTASIRKFSFSGYYMYTTSTNPANSTFYYRRDITNQNTLQQFGIGNSTILSKNWNGDLTYELNSRNVLTVSYGGNSSRNVSIFSQRATLQNANGEQTEAYKNINTGLSKLSGSDFAFDYEHSFKKNDARQLTFSYRSSENTSLNNNNLSIEPLFDYKEQTSLTTNEDISREQNLQADYMQPIKNHTIEFGINAIWRKNNSDYFYQNRDTNTYNFVLDTTQSNNFRYNEVIYAAYASLNFKMGKWGLSTEARAEQSNINARFISSGTFAAKKFSNVIPVITLSRQLKGISTLKLSYTQRLQRPDLYYLNPYVDRTDPWNLYYGNPRLQSSLSHVFNILYYKTVEKTFISIGVFHQFTNNAIQQITTLGPDTVAHTTFSNIGKNKNFSLSLSANTILYKKLSLNLNSTTNYVQYTRMLENKPHTNAGLSCSITGSLSARLKNWYGGINVNYTTPTILAQGRTAHYTSSSITLNRGILKKNKVGIGISVNNPLQKYRRSTTEISDPTFYQLHQSVISVRRFGLSVNYKFAKIKTGNK